MPRRKKSRRKNPDSKKFNKILWTITFLIVASIVILIMYVDYSEYKDKGDAIFRSFYEYLQGKTEQVEIEPTPSKTRIPKPTKTPQSKTTTVNRHAVPTRRKYAIVSIIIDDMGYGTKLEKKFVQMEWKLNFAVIPYLNHSVDMAKFADDYNREVLIHMPMEPMRYPEIDPGEKALLVSLSLSENRSRFINAVDTIPYAIGINNHMGSRFTQDSKQIKNILKEIQHFQLFFVDSRTTPRTVAYNIAIQMGIPCAKRDIFLDHEDKYTTICNRLEELKQIALDRGKAIGIGHPRPETFRSIVDMLPGFNRAGVEIVPISKIVGY